MIKEKNAATQILHMKIKDSAVRLERLFYHCLCCFKTKELF